MWRCLSLASGEQCAMIVGMTKTPESSAQRWDAPLEIQQPFSNLVEESDRSGWMGLVAPGAKPACLIAITMDGGSTTVDIMKTQVMKAPASCLAVR